MPSPAYHESLWEGVPEGLAPSDARLREAFLLSRVAPGSELADPPWRAPDLAGGEGHFAAALAREGVEVVAVDVAEEPLRRARGRHPGLDLRLVEPEAPLPLDGSSFDIVWAGETIEHVADVQRWLSEGRCVLRSGGVLLVTTPDHGPLWRARLW